MATEALGINAIHISPPLGAGRCAGMRVDGGMCRNPAELRATVTYCWCCGEEDAWCGTCADPDRNQVALCRPCAEVVRGWPSLEGITSLAGVPE